MHIKIHKMLDIKVYLQIHWLLLSLAVCVLLSHLRSL